MKSNGNINKINIEHNNDNNNINNSDDDEWTLLNELLRTSSSISITSNPSLITKAAKNYSIDTLAMIIEYGVDLSEKSCIKILYYIMMLSNDISVSNSCSADDHSLL